MRLSLQEFRRIIQIWPGLDNNMHKFPGNVGMRGRDAFSEIATLRLRHRDCRWRRQTLGIPIGPHRVMILGIAILLIIPVRSIVIDEPVVGDFQV